MKSDCTCRLYFNCLRRDIEHDDCDPEDNMGKNVLCFAFECRNCLDLVSELAQAKLFNSSDQYQMKYERFAGLVSVLQTTQTLELKKRRRQHLDDT